MGFMDQVRDGIHKIGPSNHSVPPPSMSGGIGNGGHGMVFDDDMIVSKPTIVFHASQTFFNFLAMACFAGVASFQAKWKVGPSGLSGFALFVSIAGIFLSMFMLLVPVIYEKYDKLARLARALKEVRVGFILTGSGVTFSLLIAFITTISAFTQPGCKDASKDPHAGDTKDGGLGEDFEKGLPGWCMTKKAGAIFFWLAAAFWLASLGYLIYNWRTGKLSSHSSGPRDPPFQRPMSINDRDEEEELDGDDESSYHHIPPVRTNTNPPATGYGASTGTYGRDSNTNPASPFADTNRYSGRPSMDAYGAFSDPAPSGFGSSTPGFASSTAPSSGGYSTPPRLPEPDMGGGFGSSTGGVSRTMQYADPYAAVRANIAGGQAANQSQTTLPTYESYQGYR